MLAEPSNRNKPDQLKVALLTNFIAPYRIALFQELARRVKSLRVMISIRMEADRFWEPDFGGLDVVVQRNFMCSFQWKHPSGFREKVYIHFPYDSVPRLVSFRPDVIISGEFGFRTMNALFYRLFFRRCRLVIWATISEATEEGRWVVRRAFRRLIVQFADAIVTNGRSGARYLETLHVPSHKVFAIPQTTDPSGFAAVSLVKDRRAAYRLLFVGRLISLKAVKPFAEILSAWCRDNPHQQVEFWLAGDGPERASIAKVNLPPNLSLTFLGNIPYDDLPGIYQQAGALVLPTLADEWGLVINEALAAGLPVLGSLYSQAVQELIEEGVNGWTFFINRPDEVRATIQRFFDTDCEDLAQMRVVARQTALGLTPKVVVERMMRAVRFTLGEARQPETDEAQAVRVEAALKDS